MVRVDLPYVDEPARGYFYYRRGKLRRRLPGIPGSAEFNRAYEAAHALAEAGDAAEKKLAPPEHSLAALIATYRGHTNFISKAPATKVDYEKALKPLEEHYGHLDARELPRPFVLALREKYAKKPGPEPGSVVLTPRRGTRMVAVLSILMSLAVDLGWRKDNPALRPGKALKGPGYRSWTDAELEQLLCSPAVDEEIKVAVLLAVGTGQRGQDLICMTWADYDGTAVNVCQLKTRAKVWVPLHARARAALAKLERRSDTILTRADGEPWKIDHFRHRMGEAFRDAGLPPSVVTHGLRAMAARWLAEAGCSEREIMSITGHQSSASVTKYVREANQRIQAVSATKKVARHHANTKRTPSAKSPK
jgi:integrase